MKNLSISYAKLYQAAKDMSVTIERDMSDFQQAGINPTMFEDFKSATDKVMTNFDQTYLFDKMQLTSDKDELETKIKQALRKVFLIQARAYKLSNGRIGAGLKAISNYNSDELLGAGIGATDTMSLQLASFTKFQIDQAYIDGLRALLFEYSVVKSKIRNAINERNLATVERKEMAQSVYNDLSFFAQMGKAIYAGVNEAKYNDYILGFSTSAKTQDEEPQTNPENVPPDDGTNTQTQDTASVTNPADETLELKEPNYSQF